MRILLTTDSFPPDCGGSGWSTYEVANELRVRGHELLILQPMPRGRHDVNRGSAPATQGVRNSRRQPRPGRKRHYDGFVVNELRVFAPNLPYVRNYFKNERLYRRLTKTLTQVITEQPIDLVHAQHVMTGPPSIAAARSRARPVVCTVRDYWPVCYWSTLIHDYGAAGLCPACSPGMMCRCVRPRAGALWPLALPMIPYMRANLARKRVALADADAIVAVSSALARDLRARAPELGATRFEVIPNPIDFSTMDAQEPRLRREPRPLADRYILYAGKLAPNKGVGKLLDAMARSRLRLPLVLVGDGPDRPALQTQAARLGLSVQFTGWRSREEVWRWMAHAAILAFPSHGPESLSRVLLEASALGVPIAAMDRGGTREIVLHERTGLLSTDEDGFANDLSRLAGDRALATTLATGARRHAREKFDVKVVVTRLEALYRELTWRLMKTSFNHGDHGETH